MIASKKSLSVANTPADTPNLEIGFWRFSGYW